MPDTYKTYASNDTLSKRADDLTYNEILDRNRIKTVEDGKMPIAGLVSETTGDVDFQFGTANSGKMVRFHIYSTSNYEPQINERVFINNPSYYDHPVNIDLRRGVGPNSKTGQPSFYWFTHFTDANNSIDSICYYSLPIKETSGDYTIATTADISSAVSDATGGLANAIALSYNATTGVVTATLKHGNTTVDTATLDLPLESTIVSASYDNATKDLTFTLQTGSTITVPLDDIISGLATESYVTSAISTATTGMATQTYVTSAISTALADYVTSASLSTTLASYVTSSYLTTNYYNKTTSDANYAPKSPTWSTYPTIA